MDFAHTITPKSVPVDSVPSDCSSVRKRKSYSHQFKLEAVRLSYEGEYSVSELGRMLSVNESLLHRWKRQLSEEALAMPPPTNGVNGSSHKTGSAVLQHFNDELTRLREERDVLKRAIAILMKSQG